MRPSGLPSLVFADGVNLRPFAVHQHGAWTQRVATGEEYQIRGFKFHKNDTNFISSAPGRRNTAT